MTPTTSFNYTKNFQYIILVAFSNFKKKVQTWFLNFYYYICRVINMYLDIEV